MNAGVIWTAGLLFGVFLIFVVVLATAVKAWEVWRARHWIPTQGTVLRSEIKNRRLKNRRGPSDKQFGNFPEITYEYNVDGKSLRGRRVNVTPSQPDVDLQSVLDRYPVGTGVIVYYNPQNSAESVLEREWPAGLGSAVLGLIAFIVVIAYGVPWLLTRAESELAPHISQPDHSWFVIFTSVVGLFLVWLYAAIRKDQLQARDWPSTTGTILKSQLESFHASGKGTGALRPVHFRTVILYEYQVEGRRYHGDRVCLGSGVTGATRFRQNVDNIIIVDRTNGRATAYSPFHWMVDRVRKYVVGTQIPVFYDPRQPTSSVLEPHASGPYLLLLIAAGLFIAALGAAFR